MPISNGELVQDPAVRRAHNTRYLRHAGRGDDAPLGAGLQGLRGGYMIDESLQNLWLLTSLNLELWASGGVCRLCSS